MSCLWKAKLRSEASPLKHAFYIILPERPDQSVCMCMCMCACVCVRDTWNWNDALRVQMHEHHHSIPHYFTKFKQKPAGFYPQWQLFKLTFDLLCKKKKEREKNRDSVTECLKEFLAFCPHSSPSFFCSVSNSLSFQKVRNLRLSIRLHVKEQVRPKSQG